MKQAITKTGSSRIRELSGSQRGIVTGVAVAIILLAVFSLLSQMGLLGGPDVQAGYYALQVNPDPNATQKQQFENSVFGFDRLALNADGTFRMGFLKGDWRRSGSTVTLNPTTLPPSDQFYSKTSMAQALTILFKPTEFNVSADGKKLTAANPTNGPVVLVKTNDVMR